MENAHGSVQVLPQLTSLNQVVFDLVDMYQPAFAQKRLGSGLDLDAGLPQTWIDAPQLERGLANLLRHTVKSSHDGDLILCRTESDGDWVQLTIGDSGRRLSAERAAAIFEQAGRAAAGAAEDQTIDTTRAVVAAHGGEVSLDTNDDGAWFVVRLPALAIENSRLAQQLEHDNRLLYDLVANLSHELRTPLNVIIGYDELMLDGAFGQLSPAQADTLSRMDDSARDVFDLVNAALDLSRRPAERRARPRRKVMASLALENQRLVEQLEEARRMKADFVSSTSHQLRVPLNIISGYNDLLIEEVFGRVTKEQAGVLHRVRSSTLDLLNAINTNLDLTRFEQHASAARP